jgi:hypothetical protein
LALKRFGIDEHAPSNSRDEQVNAEGQVLLLEVGLHIVDLLAELLRAVAFATRRIDPSLD